MKMYLPISIQVNYLKETKMPDATLELILDQLVEQHRHSSVEDLEQVAEELVDDLIADPEVAQLLEELTDKLVNEFFEKALQ